MTLAKDEQAALWSRIAPKWLELDDQLALEVFGALPANLAMDQLNVLPGRRVLDLGCGTGRTTLELAALVGSAGAVSALTSRPGVASPGALAPSARPESRADLGCTTIK